MRLGNWRVKEVFNAISEVAIDEVNDVADDIVVAAKQAAPKLVNLKQERPAGWRSANVTFTPKTRRGKKIPKAKRERVSFHTDKQWLGRTRGDLARTVRRVTRDDRPGNVRVYAGNFKIYYAHMVEKTGYTGRDGKFYPPRPFLRNPFNVQKAKFKSRIKSRVNQKIAQVG